VVKDFEVIYQIRPESSQFQGLKVTTSITLKEIDLISNQYGMKLSIRADVITLSGINLLLWLSSSFTILLSRSS
jgi:hypothetical protein